MCFFSGDFAEIFMNSNEISPRKNPMLDKKITPMKSIGLIFFTLESRVLAEFLGIFRVPIPSEKNRNGSGKFIPFQSDIQTDP